MSRAMWSGSISFGLVNIPVKMFSAVRNRDIHFHLLSKDGASRLQRRFVRADRDEEVDYAQTQRGYEIAPDQYVKVSQEELESLRPETRRTIDIEDFVELKDIDPIYFDKTYYLAPDERGAKAYRLFYEAMSKSEHVAVARFVMRGKEYLCALRPMNESVVALATMHYADEIVPPKELGIDFKGIKVDSREIHAAEQLISSLLTDFKPDKYKNLYREQLMKLIERKSRGEQVVTQTPKTERGPRVINLMDALQKSLAAARAGNRRMHPGEAPADRDSRRSERTRASRRPDERPSQRPSSRKKRTA